MIDGDDPVTERADLALRAAFDERARSFQPSDLDPALIRRQSRKGRLLRVGSAAAAVMFVAGATTYGVGWWADHGPEPRAGTPIASQPSRTGPPANARQLRAENQRRRVEAGREAQRVLDSMPEPVGARRVHAADVPPLARSSSAHGSPDATVTRSGFWLVPADAEQLADWYSLNPPPGMRPDSGPHGVGGGRNTDGSWSQEVVYDETRTGLARHSSALVEVTPVGDQAGVRITVSSFWSPARPLQSFAPDDVTAVRLVVVHNGQRTVTTVRTATDIARLVRTYNTLAGTHGFVLSCPYFANTTQYRITFDSVTREVSADFWGSCNSSWQVDVDGSPLAPALVDRGRLTGLISELVN